MIGSLRVQILAKFAIGGQLEPPRSGSVFISVLATVAVVMLGALGM